VDDTNVVVIYLNGIGSADYIGYEE